jgi:hypothetical protein
MLENFKNRGDESQRAAIIPASIILSHVHLSSRRVLISSWPGLQQRAPVTETTAEHLPPDPARATRALCVQVGVEPRIDSKNPATDGLDHWRSECVRSRGTFRAV